MTTLFLSGPITGHKDYREAFKDAQLKLEALGYEVINPAELCAVLPESATWTDYMTICLDLLQLADGICQLPGWEASRGAQREYAYAIAADKLVLSLEALLRRKTYREAGGIPER